MKKELLFGKSIALLMLFAFMGLVSCSDDETSGNPLIGTWELIKREGHYILDGEKDSFSSEDNPEYYDIGEKSIFYKNGTFYIEGEEGKWSLKNNILSMSFYDEEDGWDELKCNIVTLNDYELIIDYHEIESNYEYYNKVWFKKVN